MLMFSGVTAGSASPEFIQPKSYCFKGRACVASYRRNLLLNFLRSFPFQKKNSTMCLKIYTYCRYAYSVRSDVTNTLLPTVVCFVDSRASVTVGNNALVTSERTHIDGT